MTNLRDVKPTAESLKNWTAEDSYFYSLCRPATPTKKRSCLKCRTKFNSLRGSRLCSHCKDKQTVGALALFVAPDPTKQRGIL